MILYNITTLVAWPIHQEWKTWIIETHIPEILSTGFFTHHQLVKLLEVNEEEGPTYALQLYAEAEAGFNRYRDMYEQSFERKSRERWGDMACSFASLMEVVN